LEECGVSTNRYSKDVNKIDKYGKRLLDLCNSRESFLLMVVLVVILA
jgi:hypothetical protein